MTEKAVIMDAKAMQRAVARISYEIIERNKGVNGLCVIGVMSRGVNLAQRVAQKIEEVEGKRIPLGMLDIPPTAMPARRMLLIVTGPNFRLKWKGRKSFWWMM